MSPRNKYYPHGPNNLISKNIGMLFQRISTNTLAWLENEKTRDGWVLQSSREQKLRGPCYYKRDTQMH